MMTKTHRINDMALGGLRPEKAGVGGSIPSLATTFSTTCPPVSPDFHSNWQGIRLV